MEPQNPAELVERLELVEEMIAEGRRVTESWGWVFLLWGAGALIGLIWEDRWPHAAFAWPAVMLACAIVNGIVTRLRKRRRHTVTTVMRSVRAVWGAAGVTMVMLTVAAVASQASDFRYIFAAIFGLTAAAHCASSIILRWMPQFIAALIWWGASIAGFVVPAEQLHTVAAIALLAGNMGFGAWLSYREWSREDA